MKNLDPTRCQFDNVLDRSMRFPRPHQCYRKPVKDGFCTQHHPDKIKEREEQTRVRDQERWDNSPLNRLLKAHDKIRSLERKVKRLEKQLKECREELKARELNKDGLFP